LLAPEVSAQILSIRPDVTRFIGARRRRKHVDTSDAEDEVQEALTEIVRSVPQYRPELGEFRPWALGIALNVHRRFSRNRTRQRGCFSEQEINADDHETPEPSPERRLQIQEARGHLASANRNMPEAQYAALYLHAIEGHSHAEIANELGITETASKQLVYRARTYLAQCGLNEKTFFSALPIGVESPPRNEASFALWREAYDWFFRLGHILVLLLALALAGPIKPLVVARAWLVGFGREHKLVPEQPASVPDELASATEESSHDPTKPPKNAASAPCNVVAPPHQGAVRPANSRFQAKPYDLSLMVRKNP